ncbi:hypothetical protein [uncultured Brachyspira sp.]|uniref:hypothetical protein n=1 Tax=uncultured Brachyspira sp. TaxID=221953 RepID=UPI0025ED0DD4|nr:hypothetical protein [uncultured Brachyspira sp.]
MKFGILAVILMTLSFIFYNEMKKDNYNIIIKENEENNIYNANYMFRSHTYCTFFSLKKAGIPYNLIN